MTNYTRSTVMTAALLSLVAGAAFAADSDQTGQAGQYQSSVNATRVKGTGADFAPSTVWVPFILRNDVTTGANSVNSQLNGPIAERIGGVGYGAVTTFSATGTGTPGTAAPRVVAMLGTVDGDPRLSTGTSNNTIVDEGSRNLSNSLGSLLPDGTITFSERFGTGTGFAQNNIAGFNAAHTLGVAPVIGGPNKTVVSTAVNYGNAGETAINPVTATVLGSAFVGAPSSVRDPNRPSAQDENLLTGITTFNGNPTLTAAQRAAGTNGVVIFDGLNNDPTSILGPTVAANCNVAPGIANLYTPGPGTLAYWLQANVPIPTNPAGECFADARQTKPALAVVRTPSGASVPYQIHGVGFSGGTPFNGGSARPLYFVVDSVYAPGSTTLGRGGYAGNDPTLANNSIIIEADAAGGVGAIHGRPYDNTAPAAPGFADHFNSDPNLTFVDAQATGGGGGQSTLSQFDMNSRGQVAALWANEGVFPRVYEVRVYDPIWNGAGNRIEGYTLGRVITFTNDPDTGIVDSLVTTAETTPGVFQEVGLVPISGVSLSDDGRVAFYAATEKFTEVGDFDANPFTPDTTFLNNTTNTVFVYDETTNTLHSILKGGQNGDTLADAFPAGGPATNESLILGFFPVDAASDTMGRNSLSSDGTLLAINFRSGGNEVLNGANVELETRPGALPDTFVDRGGVLSRGSGATLNNRAVRGTVLIGLGDLITAPVCCPGDADGNSLVTFGDITAVLANFGATYPSGQGAGDANCDLSVNFSDITTVLANFGASCN